MGDALAGPPRIFQKAKFAIMMKWATLCYVRRTVSGRHGHREQTLMLHRVKRANDMHAGKWNGLGGKFLPGETPEACVIREVEEESGLRLHKPELRGLLTFPQFNADEDWYAFVFVARHFSGTLIDCNEGELHWIDNAELLDLNLWDGDRVFIPWLDAPGFFSARFSYAGGEYVGHDVAWYGAANEASPGRNSAASSTVAATQSAYLTSARAGAGQPGFDAQHNPDAKNDLDSRCADAAEEREDDECCWLCGGPVFKHHCKITCTVCGFRRDCSDP